MILRKKFLLNIYFIFTIFFFLIVLLPITFALEKKINKKKIPKTGEYWLKEEEIEENVFYSFVNQEKNSIIQINNIFQNEINNIYSKNPDFSLYISTYSFSNQWRWGMVCRFRDQMKPIKTDNNDYYFSIKIKKNPWDSNKIQSIIIEGKNVEGEKETRQLHPNEHFSFSNTSLPPNLVIYMRNLNKNIILQKFYRIN